MVEVIEFIRRMRVAAAARTVEAGSRREFAVVSAATGLVMLKHGMQVASARAADSGGSLVLRAATSPWVLLGLVVFGSGLSGDEFAFRHGRFLRLPDRDKLAGPEPRGESFAEFLRTLLPQ